MCYETGTYTHFFDLFKLVFEVMGFVSVLSVFRFIKNKPLFDDSLGLCVVSLEAKFIAFKLERKFYV